MVAMRVSFLISVVMFAFILSACTSGRLPVTSAPVTVQAGSPVANYDAAKAIQTYASQVLGLQVQVEAARGRGGSITLPDLARDGMEVAVKIAGATYSGRLDNVSGFEEGLTSVSLGDGAVSGDLSADIDTASLGAFVFNRAASLPADEKAALTLLKSAFPKLSSQNYTSQPTQGKGYAFKSISTTNGLNVKTGKVEAVGQAVLAGVSPGLRANQILVWVVVGKGALSKGIK